MGSKGALALIDKEAVLSPYPGTGSILPILATNKGDIYNAAILNGYADIVDRVAKSLGLQLEHSIGNANRDTINILRILIYGFICFALLYYAQRRIKRKKMLETKKFLALWYFAFTFGYNYCLYCNDFYSKSPSCV